MYNVVWVRVVYKRLLSTHRTGYIISILYRCKWQTTNFETTTLLSYIFYEKIFKWEARINKYRKNRFNIIYRVRRLLCIVFSASYSIKSDDGDSDDGYDGGGDDSSDYEAAITRKSPFLFPVHSNIFKDLLDGVHIISNAPHLKEKERKENNSRVATAETVATTTILSQCKFNFCYFAYCCFCCSIALLEMNVRSFEFFFKRPILLRRVRAFKMIILKF